MRKVAILLCLTLLALVALPALAADAPKPAANSWTGWFTDSHCGAKGADAKHTKACVEKCVKEGGKVMFMNSADKKLYEVDKDHATAAMDHVGHEVKVTGTVEGTTIHVDKIEMVEAMKK